MLQLLRMALGAPFFMKNTIFHEKSRGGLQRPPNPQLNKARFARRLAAQDIMEKITFIMEKSWNNHGIWFSTSCGYHDMCPWWRVRKYMSK